VLVVAACTSAESVDSDGGNVITAEALQAHVEFLAHDLLEGRGTGSRGHEIAAHYVAGVFRGLGLEPGGAVGTYMSPVRLRRSTIDPTRSNAAILRNGRVEPLALFEDIFLGGPSDGSLVEAPAVFAGWGITAPAFSYDDYVGVDAAGKVVVMLYGTPPSITGDAAAHYSSPSAKRRIAGEHGAVGMVVIPTEALLSLAPWEVIAAINSQPQLGALDAAGNPLGATTGMRAGGLVSPSAAQRLFAAAPAPWNEVRQAAAAGTTESFDLGIRLRLTVAARLEDITSPNVVGVLRGSDPDLSDEYVVVTAHLDHDGIGAPVDGDSIYNGALDNAAGVAAMLETARALRYDARPRRSILFLATTAEEK
jgi:hypothetical protein